MKDWTDSMSIDELQKEQDKGNVITGLVPASVYKAAIEHYSFNSLQNPLRREEDEANRVNTDVGRFALRHMFTDPSAIRESMVLVLGDSGSSIYKSSSHPTVDELFGGKRDGDWGAVKQRWPKLQGVRGCGAGWADWIEGMKKVLGQARENSILECDPDGVCRAPAYYHVICLDNLNTIDALTPEEEKSVLNIKLAGRKPLTTFEGSINNGILRHELNELMSYLGLIKSAIYVGTAPASRWDMPQEVDLIADEIVNRVKR